jgi:hypothetical protein
MGSCSSHTYSGSSWPTAHPLEVVHRGVEVADPTGQFGVADLLPPVEDVDEQVTGHRDIELELAELKGRLDPRTRTRR